MELISLLIAETIKLVQQNQFCTNKANKKRCKYEYLSVIHSIKQ